MILSGYKKGTFAYRVDGRTPRQIWKSRKVSMSMSSPILKKGRLYGFSEKRRGQYFCLDAKTGKVLWTSDGRQAENAALVDTGNFILSLTTRSELVVFHASDEEYKEVARYTVADTPTWAHPVVSGRTITVKDENSLIRWTIP